MQTLGIGSFLLVLLVFFSLTTQYFLSYTNALNILSNVAVLGIVSLGQAFVIISGGFDLSVSGTVPLGVVTYAVLVNSGIGVPIATLLTIALGALVGLANGSIITKLGINPLVTTLATLSITQGLAFTITGGAAVALARPDEAFLNTRTIGGVAYYIWALLLLSLLAAVVLRYTVFGRSLYAIGGNREASRLAGIRVDLVTTVVYMISGAAATFAGVVLANQLLIGTPSVGRELALSSIAAVILGGASLAGGVGGIPGTLLGVLVLGAFANGMALMFLPVFYQQVATGGVLLLAVGFSRLRSLLGEEA